MKLVPLLLVLSYGAFAQSGNPDIPSPSVLTEKYLEAISERKNGQKNFAVRVNMFEQQQQSQAGSGGDRDIQESDIYKLGKEGKKELFLLNNYRGFQVVNFEEGIEKPKIAGRLPIYNNWSSEMYYLKKQDQVIIVNTEWSYEMNYWDSHYNTELYLVDVADTSEPKIVKSIKIPGSLDESRLVGDVLYTVTTNGSWDNRKAMVSSVKITPDSLQTIDKADLHSGKNWVNTMNVVKDGERYYVISTLTSWGNDAGDMVNVHDITNSAGKIQKLFTARSRGRVNERSQTFIHKNHLFAVSNYRNGNAPSRISVEAYPMKSSSGIVVSAENMRASIGDTNGLHASLQDVRVSGDLLYTFWVPANQIDPFDLFDISEPSKGFKHLGQLQFDGWISKAFPIDHNGRKFVLGLGEIVPATEENGRRFPQAKLFEIKNVNGQIKHEVVSSITLDSDDVWSSMNSADKKFEIVQEQPGVYNVLFPVTFKKGWKSGAKVVTADLNNSSLSEGASIVAQDAWLNRVFLNQELRAVNAFSDTHLEIFDQDDLPSAGIARTVGILELARNVVDFHALSATEGLQVINSTAKVELRKVSLDNSDAELDNVLQQAEVKGQYSWHRFLNNKLYIITNFYKKVRYEGSTYEYSKFDYANLNVVDLSSLAVEVSKLDLTPSDSHYLNIETVNTSKFDVIKINKDIFRLNQQGLAKLPVESDCQYFFDDEGYNLSLNVVGDDVYAYNSFQVNPTDTNTNSYYNLPFIKKLSLEGSTIACTASTNVPGKPIWKKDNFLVTNSEEGYGGFSCGWDYRYDSYYDYYVEDETFALMLNDKNEAVLVDTLKKNISSRLSQYGLVSYTSREARVDFWDLTSKGQFTSTSQYLDYQKNNNVSLVAVKTLNGKDYAFIKNKKKFDLYEISQDKRFNKLNITATYDGDLNDGSAEYIYNINNISVSPDSSRFHVSQGHYGVADLIIQ